MTKEALLFLLDRSEGYLSGSAICQRFGVTRAAVWKGVEALRQEGWEIESAPRRGYRLLSGPDRLRPGVLMGAGKVIGSHLECLDTISSTNDYIRERAWQGAPHGLVVTAEEQTGGRGRQGRSFQSPRGKGLYLSVLLRPRFQPLQAVSLTPWVAVAVCRALERLTPLRPSIKWTNDVLIEGKKVCGILTEMEMEGETASLQSVIIGIGVNVGSLPADFSPEVASVATSLAQHMDSPPTRIALARAILEELDQMYADFPHQHTAYLRQYRDRCTTPGNEVEVIFPQGTRRGFARCIDEEFRLVVAFEDGGVEPVSSGEVSLRGQGAL